MSLFFSQQELTVCPNERQALAWWEEDAQSRREQGEKAWETPAVCSWSDFVRALWEEFWLSGSHQDAHPPLLMNEWQERFLWLKVLADSNQGEGLLNLPAAAKLAMEAWRLANSHFMIPYLRQENYWPEETQVFLGWADDFLAQCRERGWLDPCRLETLLAERLRAGAFPPETLPLRINFRGFAEWTPTAEDFLSALAEAGTQVSRAEPSPPSVGEWQRTAAATGEEEITLAARWLRDRLEEKRSLKVALVVPDLAQRRDEVERLLGEVFQPSQRFTLVNEETPSCDFSVGRPLARWPLVEHALAFLALDDRYRPLDEWARLLTSPFTGESREEFYQRGRLLEKLRSGRRFRVDVRRLHDLATPGPEGEELRPFRCPALARRLVLLQEKWRQTPLHQWPSEWSTHFSEVLDLIGWPGQRTLTSSEFQTVNRWKRTLSQMGCLDSLLGQVSREKALSAVVRIAEETVYQPKRTSARVEVMGTLEAVGLRFDYLWLAGVHDGVWPASARPNPYLPFSLQRERQVAHSTPERELEFARKVTEGLLRATRVGVVSYPLFEGEESCRLSPLFSSLPAVNPGDLKLSACSPLATLVHQSARLERGLDPGPPEVALDTLSRGGTSLFKHQAACPFRAFAYLRLDARPAEIVKAGLDARQRGTMLHASLEKLWELVGSQSRWLSWNEEERRRALTVSADFGVEEMRRERPDVLKGVMVSLERARLMNLLEEWMATEMERAPFEVLATEEKVELQFSGLTMRATIDRVDRLADGTLAVIDYKTGRPQIHDWLGPRPKEPQLPLYSVAHPTPVSAICFAVVRPGDMGFQGLADQDDKIPGVKASEFAGHGLVGWTERQTEWREILEALAEEFRHGRAVVDPHEGPKSCQFCGLQSLCRVDDKEEEE